RREGILVTAICPGGIDTPMWNEENPYPYDESEMILSANSQMEVRTLGAIAKEQALLDAFEQGIDVHRMVAGKVWGLPPEEVTMGQRRFAKMASFCLVGETLIRLANNEVVRIDELVNRPTFLVPSLDLNDGARVNKIGFGCKIVRFTKELVKLTFDNGTSVICTPEHKFFELRFADFREASKLLVGNIIGSNLKKPLRIRSVEHITLDKDVPTYCFEVEDTHNFFLECGALSSNSILYGKSVAGFATDYLRGDFQAAQKFFDDFFNAYPNVKKYIDESHRLVLEQGWVPTLFGDPIYVNGQNDNAKKRHAQNYRIQSSASSLAGIAIWKLWVACQKLGIRGIPIGFTHDSSDWELHAKHLFPYLSLVYEVAANRISEEFKIPVAIDVEIG
ncbi:MAG: hypothetical protein GY861_15520, partial [bacterium]|nr:hypothetical protein [bacterium]